MVRRAFIGPVIQTDENGNFITIEKSAMLVENGKITRVMENIDKSTIKDFGADEVVILDKAQFFIPGFIDGHTHAVQFPNLGVGYDKHLLDWLETYTFPLEKRYIDANFADRTFEAVVRQTINMGTTTACYFASLYAEASAILARKAAQLGQRAFVGKVNMNIQRADGYCETTKESIRNTEKFVKEIEQIGSSLVKPIITPRFALSCDMELMTTLASIAKQKDLHIQSHVSENKTEVELVKKTFSQHPSYTAVYDAAGLLTNKTVMAHGIYLTDPELDILKARGTAVIHCPSSNTCLRSGLCDVQRLKAKEVKIGLGTDVSGGQSYSILDAMKAALQVSYHLSILKDDYTPLDYKDVFHMATLGGANALSIDDRVGNLVSGKEFDALVVDLSANNNLFNDLMNVTYTLEERLQRFIYSGDDRNIIAVYISGKKVK